MIIRKPYAFLIKNFKKIHILLLALAIYVYFKSNQTYSFLREFITTGAYDVYHEPISKYVTIFGIASSLILVIICAIIVRLLKRKDKPWMLYLIPVVQYTIIFFAFVITKNFMKSYSGTESVIPLRMWRDMLLVSQATQFATFIILFIRIFGVDLNKFNFKFDEEYLELEARDREELEINVNIDKEAFKRTYRKFMRNLNYIYQEHKLICNIAIAIVVIIIGYNSISYIISHRSYKEGAAFKVNGYEIKINNSYYTNKSYNGKIVSKKSSFVIVDLTLKNTTNQERTVDLNRFHIMNGISDYTTTEKMYGTEFQDLGKTYDSLKIRAGESTKLIMVYKVDKDLKVNRFVLYYQEFDTKEKFLRKIRLNIQDVSEVKNKGMVFMGDKMSFVINDQKETIIFEDYDIDETQEYVLNVCNTVSCNNETKTITAPDGYQIMKLSFGSDTYEGKDMKNFAKEYGKVSYTDKNGKVSTIELVNPISRTYHGKYLYVRIPNAAVEGQELNLEFTIRNRKYTYKIF